MSSTYEPIVLNEDETCRYCLYNAPAKDLIQPCNCKGGSLLVHRQCLNKWRSSSEKAFYECNECRFKYLFVDDQVAIKESAHRRWALAMVVVEALVLLLLFIAAIALLALIPFFLDATHPRYVECLGLSSIFVFFFLGIIGFIHWLIVVCTSSGGRGGGGSGGNIYYCPGNGGGGDSKDACMIMIAICVIIGVFYAVYTYAVIIQGIIERRLEKKTLFYSCKERVVVDRRVTNIV